jgi:hypothetical protein
LDEKNGCEGSPGNLVRDVAFVVLDVNDRQLFGKIGITDIPAL